MSYGYLVSANASENAKSSLGQQVLNTKCVACHAALPGGGLDRISEGRRTPEGWDMTVARMGYAHGMKLTQEERHAVVKYLADTRGLAPEEAANHRYILEKTPGVVEQPSRINDKVIVDSCARCHSAARVGLQRRTFDDWQKLVAFHVGQYPAIEFQYGGRDREWFKIANSEVAKLLADNQPEQSDLWKKWSAKEKANVDGEWLVAGHRPGWGAYSGSATITRSAADAYQITMSIRYENGKTEKASGNATVFTGYEWRASLNQNGDAVRQVFSLSEDGQRLEGRWYLTDHEDIGGRFTALKQIAGAPGQVLSVQPSRIKVGQTQKLTIRGTGLTGNVTLGDGVAVTRVLKSSPTEVVVEVRADAKAKDGYRQITMSNVTQKGATVAVYRQIDSIRIEPKEGMARVGGNGGPIPKKPVQFEAIAYANGPDGKVDTEDDVRIGHVVAQWSLANLNKNAEEMQDLQFAGTLSKNGLFMPNNAGPNPERKYSTNNAGELKVKAVVKEGAKVLSASTHLMVTVQRFVDPPIH
ncbi:quinohemoprotein amine dehydrogenase subunit alpha [Noviherbaspirillum sp. CPCC 100848]|uniref:Quinohemoprotein amine dehydrogenase subunit alpha n=1 Tax=Noviherbaspirillum album TaxID=3080276 RepID=A0ABU6JGM5_9BURK|nr:quinohemoprotein amine dehydrogenase subunit alpha [Noviherbaspirillum sp. CPCC 100848]MEC4722807.1 quinohemoprotein amine dehydrogenase subunit alpha [Noviherbaspirillum sp. CPCC 100848]